MPKCSFFVSVLLTLVSAVSVQDSIGQKAVESKFKPLSDQQADGFSALISGDSMDGWIQRGGKASYTVKDGAVTGTCVKGEPNSFLCTEKQYGNFVLELEFKVDNAMNSGVQIRSECFPEAAEIELPDGSKKKVPAGRVHGYQVEIDPSERSWSGGIYDEARRGWINDLSKNEAARNALKRGEWNKYRIKCDGDHIQTWINGVPAADLKDSVTSKGFIALQVHGAYSKTEMIGTTVQWRNIQIKELP